MAELPNVKAAIKRQSAPGSAALLVCALIVFGPKTWDFAIGEPWIEAEVALVETSSGKMVLSDVVRTNEPVRGLRANVIEDSDNHIVCSTEHHNTWDGERQRIWHIPAFTSCSIPDSGEYRVCSLFSVESASGRRDSFGPFCSQFVKTHERPT